MPEQPKVLKVRVYQDTSGDWRWRAVGRNYKTVADSSDGFKHHSDAIEAAESLYPDAVIEDEAAA